MLYLRPKIRRQALSVVCAWWLVKNEIGLGGVVNLNVKYKKVI